MPITIGTAGHVDHGKSALVEALTGVHPDRLAEERRRGMTLDLGFGHFDLGKGVLAGVVDVPGHERFVRTMLAGAGGVDIVLLVIAADSGVQPQTREHAGICRSLCIPSWVVALTKCDLANAAQTAAARAQAEALVPGAEVIAVSSRTRAGLDALQAALQRAAAALRPRDAAAPARLPIDRSFSMKGFGTVVTGTLIEGQLRSGSEVTLDGGERRLRIRGIEVYGRAAETATAGQRTAVNLAGVSAGECARGMTLCEPGVFAATRRLDVHLDTVWDMPVRHRARLRFYLNSAERLATVILLDAAGGYAQLRLDEPLVAVAGDRFLLRQLSPAATIAGGRVLDAHPRVHGARAFAAAVRRLQQIESASVAQRLLLALDQAGNGGLRVADLAQSLGRRATDVGRDLDALELARAVVRSTRGTEVILGSALAGGEQQLLAALAAFHQSHPNLPGAGLDQLAAPLPESWTGLAIQRLVASGQIRLADAVLRLPSHEPAGGATEALSARIEAHFRAAGLSALPLPEALASFAEPEARQVLAGLARAGTVIECQPRLYVHRDAVGELQGLLRRQEALSPRFSVAEFKQWTGLSRKFAIPLLEYLDRTRQTRRLGEEREILLPPGSPPRS